MHIANIGDEINVYRFTAEVHFLDDMVVDGQLVSKLRKTMFCCGLNSF